MAADGEALQGLQATINTDIEATKECINAALARAEAGITEIITEAKA